MLCGFREAPEWQVRGMRRVGGIATTDWLRYKDRDSDIELDEALFGKK